MRVAKEGFMFVLPFLILAAAAIGLGWIWVGGSLFVFALTLVFFFRDPIRYTPQDDNLIFSPADGTIIEIQDLGEDASSLNPSAKISIFLSILNVHITRSRLFLGDFFRPTKNLPVKKTPMYPLTSKETERISFSSRFPAPLRGE